MSRAHESHPHEPCLSLAHLSHGFNTCEALARGKVREDVFFSNIHIGQVKVVEGDLQEFKRKKREYICENRVIDCLM